MARSLNDITSSRMVGTVRLAPFVTMGDQRLADALGATPLIDHHGADAANGLFAQKRDGLVDVDAGGQKSHHGPLLLGNAKQPPFGGDGRQQESPLLGGRRTKDLRGLLEVDLSYLPVQLEDGVDVLLLCLAYFQ